MRVDVSQTNLRSVDDRFAFVDLYEVAKNLSALPYSMCVSEPLKKDCEYRGYSFAMRLRPFETKDAYKLSDDVYVYRMNRYVLKVRYHEYTINCNKGYYKVRSSHRRTRLVKKNEFAAGPYLAMVFATKPDDPKIFIEDIMSQQDPLYSKLDKDSDVGHEIQETELITQLFNKRVIDTSISRVDLISRLTANVDEIRGNVKDVYLNIVHNCDRYCAISTLGRFGTVPFRAIEGDSLRCARALIELPYSETYETTVFPSSLNESKGIPYSHSYHHAYRSGFYRSYVERNSFTVALYKAIPQLVGARNLNVHERTEHAEHAVTVVMCIVPAVICSAIVAYVVRSDSKFAQSVRNMFARMKQTMHGMERVSGSNE